MSAAASKFVLVPAVDRAARVLILLQRESALSITDVARHLQVSKSVARNLLETLRCHDLVERDAATKQYRLGGRLVQLGQTAALARNDLGLVARPHLERLAEATGEVALLAVPQGRQAVFVEKAESGRPGVRLAVPRGWRLPTYSGAHGKVFAAFGYAASHAAPDVRPRPAEAAHIRQQGFALDDGEYMVGVRGAAAPVFDATGSLVASVVVVGMAAGLPLDSLPQIGQLVAACAAQVSRSFGFSGSTHQRALPRTGEQR